jgi:hypothetical protein
VIGGETTKKLVIFSLLLAACLFVGGLVFAASLELTLVTSKVSYKLGENITVKGNLTLDGVGVGDGLVTVEVNDQRGKLMFLRTRNTGTNPPAPWTVEITQITLCDQAGNPKPSIHRSGYMGFKMVIKNHAVQVVDVCAVVCVQFSDGVPFETFPMYNGTLGPLDERSLLTWPLELPGDAPLGTTWMYASALTTLPSMGGHAYSPENMSSFQITTSASASSVPPRQQSLTGVQADGGAFSTTFALSPHGGMLGTYSVYASSHYGSDTVTATTSFLVRLVTDITGLGGRPDGKVDIMDLALVSSCFGSFPGHPKWNPAADVNIDGKVDVTDVAMVSADFGKYGVLP